MNIAIDEDDCIAIITRRLVKENKYLRTMVLSKVSSINSKQLNPARGNDPYITTLAALYECNEILLSGKDGGIEIDKQFKQFRKTYQEIDAYYEYLEEIWIRMIETCPDFDKVINGSRKPGELRFKRNSGGGVILNDKGKPTPGGSVFARPMGQYILCETIRNATVQGKSPLDTVDALMTNVDMNIDSRPWLGVIWNSSSHTIDGSAKERRLLTQILSYALGIKTTDKHREILQSYRDVVENQKATFPVPQISWSGASTNSE